MRRVEREVTPRSPRRRGDQPIHAGRRRLPSTGRARAMCILAADVCTRGMGLSSRAVRPRCHAGRHGRGLRTCVGACAPIPARFAGMVCPGLDGGRCADGQTRWEGAGHSSFATCMCPCASASLLTGGVRRSTPFMLAAEEMLQSREIPPRLRDAHFRLYYQRDLALMRKSVPQLHRCARRIRLLPADMRLPFSPSEWLPNIADCAAAITLTSC